MTTEVLAVRGPQGVLATIRRQEQLTLCPRALLGAPSLDTKKNRTVWPPNVPEDAVSLLPAPRLRPGLWQPLEAINSGCFGPGDASTRLTSPRSRPCGVGWGASVAPLGDVVQLFSAVKLIISH